MRGGHVESFVQPTAELSVCMFFFFNDTATTEIYTLSLHDALPISQVHEAVPRAWACNPDLEVTHRPNRPLAGDRKSTRLNSSHSQISYAVFCLKKKKKNQTPINPSHPPHHTNPITIH